MFDAHDYISQPVVANVLCRNCGHTLGNHSPDGLTCNAEDDTDADELCTPSQGGSKYLPMQRVKKSLAAAAGGFVVGAVIGGVVQGAQLLIATDAVVLGDAIGDVIITQDKLKYLLQLDPGKANGFKLLGYTLENSDKLADVLAVARTLITDSTPKVITQFGVKYTVEMEIIGANGARGLIETVWQVDHLDTAYRLITAIPKPF